MSDSYFSHVRNARGHIVRGLWIRNGIFYAQMRLADHKSPVRVRLKDAKTVAQATAALQALKVKRAGGNLDLVPVRGVAKFSDVAKSYIVELERLGARKRGTVKRESSGKEKLIEFMGSRPVTSIAMKDAFAFAAWRKKTVSGRAVDVNIGTLRRVMAKAVRDGLIPANPVGRWKALATRPKEKRLVRNEELQKLRNGAEQDFADYLELLRLSGGREQETTALRWSISVDFERRMLGFGIGELAIFSKNSKSRWMPMNDPLYWHLVTMHGRRNPESDWLFPNRWDYRQRTKSFRGALKGAMARAKVTDFGFHHLRHYFISHCLMQGIDRKTVEEWVGQEILLKVYIHITSEHSRQQAARIRFT